MEFEGNMLYLVEKSFATLWGCIHQHPLKRTDARTLETVFYTRHQSVMAEFSSETHGSSLPVINFDTLLHQPETLKRHGEQLPNTVRALVCGPSGCGKTNALLTLITHPNGLHFENIYIYSKSLSQSKYQLLQQILGGVDGVGYPKRGPIESGLVKSMGLSHCTSLRCVLLLGRMTMRDCVLFSTNRWISSIS